MTRDITQYYDKIWDRKCDEENRKKSLEIEIG
jgi:hypothetical protein